MDADHTRGRGLTRRRLFLGAAGVAAGGAAAGVGVAATSSGASSVEVPRVALPPSAGLPVRQHA
ncbi:MAG: hypothetical protein ACRDPM_01975, partial [Solirubrobacteraceae bacterium]